MFTEISLNQYRIFYAAAECGSISKAAERLFISQPAISRSVMSLEESLGVQLFRRGHRGVMLTDEGEVLYNHLKTAFGEISAAENYIRSLKESGGGHLRIGASAVLCKYMLLPYLKGFARENPTVKITIECQSSRRTNELLENGSIDVALMVRPDDLTGRQYVSLGKISDVFTAAPSFLESVGYKPHKPLSAEEFSSLIKSSGGVMLLDSQNGTRHRIDRYFRAEGIAAEKTGILEVSSMDMIIEFARTGLGIGCVIESFIRDDIKSGALAEIPLKDPVGEREVGFAAMSGRGVSAAAKRFIDFVSR